MARPQFRKTNENRELVITLCQANASKAKIAAAVGITKKTLAKYFAEELAGFISNGNNQGKNLKKAGKNQRLALRQSISITCPGCLTVIELVERDRRAEAKVTRNGQS